MARAKAASKSMSIAKVCMVRRSGSIFLLDHCSKSKQEMVKVDANRRLSTQVDEQARVGMSEEKEGA